MNSYFGQINGLPPYVSVVVLICERQVRSPPPASKTHLLDYQYRGKNSPNQVWISSRLTTTDYSSHWKGFNSGVTIERRPLTYPLLRDIRKLGLVMLCVKLSCVESSRFWYLICGVKEGKIKKRGCISSKWNSPGHKRWIHGSGISSRLVVICHFFLHLKIQTFIFLVH